MTEVVLAVHNLQAATAFYRDLLGLRQLEAPPGVQPVFLAAGVDSVAIPQMVVLVPLPPDSPAFTAPRTLHHLALELAPEDFDAEVERLSALGYALRSGRHPVLPRAVFRHARVQCLSRGPCIWMIRKATRWS